MLVLEAQSRKNKRYGHGACCVPGSMVGAVTSLTPPVAIPKGRKTEARTGAGPPRQRAEALGRNTTVPLSHYFISP